MSARFEFFFDYGIPWSYIANALVPAIAERAQAEGDAYASDPALPLGLDLAGVEGAVRHRLTEGRDDGLG